MELLGKNIVVYDCEIKEPVDGVKITWDRHHLMGLSVACLYDYRADDWNVYFDKDLGALCERLNTADLVVGFNTTGFDNKLLRALGGPLKSDEELKNWDILDWSRRSTGWRPSGRFPTGLRLDDHLRGTFGEAFMKTADGADAPGMWQRGELGRLVSYCLADVKRERMLFEHIVKTGYVITATHGKRMIDQSALGRVLYAPTTNADAGIGAII